MPRLYFNDLIRNVSGRLAFEISRRFISQRNKFFVHLSILSFFFFPCPPIAATGDATLMLLTVYLLPDRKGKERKVFQTDTHIGLSILETRSSKLFYGKVSPIVTTTKKRPCHFATYGSGRARPTLPLTFLQSTHCFRTCVYSRQCSLHSLGMEGLSCRLRKIV